MLKISEKNNFYKYKRKFYEYFNIVRNNSSHKSCLNLLFFGTDNFSLPSLKALHNLSLNNSKVSGVSVVTSFKSPANCIKCFAEANSILTYKWPVSEHICRQYDLGIVVSFGHMIPANIIDAFPLGMINVHASLLPRWRGAAPIIYSIMKGDTTTGVSIMKIEPKKFDVGGIYAQRKIEIDSHILMPNLHDALAREGANLLKSTIEAYPKSLEMPQKQNENEVTFAPKITTTVAEVNWNSMSALEVYNLYRALFGYKHLSTHFQQLNVKLVEIRLGPYLDNSHQQPGSFEHVRNAKCIRVRCNDGFSIDVLKIKVEGKRIMTALEFSNGFLRKYENNLLVFI